MAVEKVQSTGRICVLDVEINGVKSIKETELNARYIFVQPPSMDALVSFAKTWGLSIKETELNARYIFVQPPSMDALVSFVKHRYRYRQIFSVKL